MSLSYSNPWALLSGGGGKGMFFFIFPENFYEYEWTSFFKIQIKLWYA